MFGDASDESHEKEKQGKMEFGRNGSSHRANAKLLRSLFRIFFSCHLSPSAVRLPFPGRLGSTALILRRISGLH